MDLLRPAALPARARRPQGRPDHHQPVPQVPVRPEVLRCHPRGLQVHLQPEGGLDRTAQLLQESPIQADHGQVPSDEGVHVAGHRLQGCLRRAGGGGEVDRLLREVCGEDHRRRRTLSAPGGSGELQQDRVEAPEGQDRGREEAAEGAAQGADRWPVRGGQQYCEVRE